MRYINIKTGAIIDSPSKIISKKWKAIEEVGDLEETRIDEVDETDEETEEELDEEGEEKGLEKHTKSELFKMLEIQNIAYKPEQTKKELIKLLEGD